MLFHNSIQGIYGLVWATFTTPEYLIYDKKFFRLYPSGNVFVSGFVIRTEIWKLEKLKLVLMYPVINAWKRLPVHPLNGINKTDGEFNFAP